MGRKRDGEDEDNLSTRNKAILAFLLLQIVLVPLKWDVVQSIQITFPSLLIGIVNFPNGNFDNFDLRPP